MNTVQIKLYLTPTMHNFLEREVRDGRAVDKGEAVRFLIGQEIKYWEEVNRRPFPAAE